MVPHIPPKGLQIVRYAGLYAHCIKHRIALIANSALDALRLQMPLLVLEPLAKFVPHLKWRERIKASFGYDPLACPNCGRTMELAEIWEPKRGYVWMKRWLETHRLQKSARDAIRNVQSTANRIPPSRYQQLTLGLANTS
jgi:hypothetical protein